jgi:DNA-binding NtrC family response regulator
MKLSHEIQRIYEIACRSEANVVITGPTGSGKTSLARTIHNNSERRNKPFVAINLATLHEGTIESELFGHEKGAFTGADQRRMGRLELAQGGTVFLDEIGEMPPRLQARLLEVLQSRNISPVGSNREIRLNVRIIAATHHNLAQAVANGSFRADLFHRLRVLAIELKSLAERSDEFDEILHGCLTDISIMYGRSVLRISEGLAQVFETYSWPGNFRELKNVLEYCVLASEGPELNVRDLPLWFGRDPVAAFLGAAEVSAVLDYQEAMSRFEKDFIERALERYRGRINQTARKIGMNKTTLLRRMRTYGLHKSD